MGARGVNSFNGSGNVGDDVVFDETGTGDPCCSFTLHMEDKGVRVTTARINVYGGLVRVCRDRLRPGAYVVVTGELMNRGRSLTEVRARDLAIPNV